VFHGFSIRLVPFRGCRRLPSVGRIPIIVGPLWFGAGYFSWVVASILLDGADRQLERPLISSRCPWSRRFQVMFGPSDARRSLRSTSITLFGSLTSANVTRSGKSFGAILRGPGMRPMRGTSSMKSCDGASPYGASPYNGNISLISGPPSRLQRIPLSGEAHWSATRSAASRRDQGPDTGPRRGACAWCLNRDVQKLHFTAPRERHDGYRREASQARIFRQD
jgi:hypothetical protein